jgi:hypothetical protein
VTGTDPALATVEDVTRAVRRRLLTLPPGADPVDAVMSVVGPVLDARDAALARERQQARAVQDYRTV